MTHKELRQKALANEAVRKEYGDIFETAWYKKISKEITAGFALKTFRGNFGMTQTELGKKLGGVSRQHISAMEHDRRKISKATALKLARIFKTSTNRFSWTLYHPR